MDLRQLHYFTAVAEEQTISAAARKLHISQPPLSQQIKLLEDELGIRLFDRQPRKVTLTDAGHLLYRHAKNILMLSDEALHEVRDFAQGLHGTLRLGTISSSGSALLERRMLDFCNQYPDVHFELHEGNTFELLRLLEQGVIEIAVVRTPFQTDDVACAYLEEEPMSAVGWPRFFNGNHTRRLALEALTDKPLIIYRRFEQILRTAFSARMLTPNFFCINDDARTCLAWANASLGVALVPQSVTRQMARPGIGIYELEEPELRTRIAAIHKSDGYLSDIAVRFLKVFEQSKQ